MAALLDADVWPILAGTLAMVAAYYGWRSINDPPADEPAGLVRRPFPEAEVPQEAVLGFVGAVAFVGAIIALATFT